MKLIKKRSKLTPQNLIIFGILFLLSFLSFAQNQTCKEVIGYYPNWQWYDRNKLVSPSSLDYTKYSIINYSFFDVSPNGNIQITDPWADKNLLLGPINWAVAPAGYDTGYDFGNPAYHHSGQKFSDICHSNNVKLLPSIGGWTLSNNFSAIAADPIKRQTFANSCVELIDAFGFDGIDLDWEYPGYLPHNGTSQDKVNFTLLLQDVRIAIDNYGVNNNKTMILTAAVGASEDRMDDVEWINVSGILDAINLMSYDFFGAWDSQTNHNAPLTAPIQGDPTFNLTSAIDKLVNFYNVNPNKINAGVAFYGRSSKTSSTPALFANTTGLTDNITFNEDEGSPLYYNIQNKLNQFQYNWDNIAQVPYLTGINGLNTFVSYDDERSIGLKAQFIVDNNLRGAIIWEITGDYIESTPGSGVVLGTPLADTLNNVFCNYAPATNTPPTISCITNQTLLSSNGVNAILPDYSSFINVTTNCTLSNNFTLIQSPLPGSLQSIGNLIVTLTATDECGNSSSCTFNVSISNNSSLNWIDTPSDITINCDASILPSNTGAASANTTCSNGLVNVNYSDVILNGTCANTYSIVRSWTATDNCSNSISHTQNIYIIDNVAPSITCPSSTIFQSTNGINAILPNYTNQVFVSDNCSSNNAISITQLPLPGSLQSIGNVIVTLTATDECGNSSSCTFNVNISNNSSLNWIDSPSDITINCDASIIPSNTGAASANTTCSNGLVNVNYSDVILNGTCANTYSIVRSWTATDNCSNTISHTQNIYIIDNVAPSITCPEFDNIYASNGNNAILPDYSSQVIVSDNCSDVSNILITQFPIAGSTQSLGIVNIELTAIDECGLSTTCTFVTEVLTNLGINSNNFEVNVFPNPFNNEIFVELNYNNYYSIKLIDRTGRIIYSSSFRGNSISIDNIEYLSAGLYFLEISSHDLDFDKTFKVIKK